MFENIEEAHMGSKNIIPPLVGVISLWELLWLGLSITYFLKNGINKILEDVEGFGGVENVHFTSFVLQ